MYFEHFGMHRPPFEETTNPAFYYEPAHHSTILEQMMASIEAGGIVLVCGAPGTGKSVLGQVLLKRLEEDTKVLSFAAPPDGPQMGIRRICTGFGIDSPASATAEQCVVKLLNVIASRLHKCCAVLVDQAENLSTDDLLALHQLLHSASENKIRLAIVLRATVAINTTLRLPELKLFVQSLVRTPTLEALDDHETLEYLSKRIDAAGGSIDDVMTPDARRRIALISGGWPREINTLAKKALIRAANSDLSIVDENTVVSSSKEKVQMDDHRESARPVTSAGSDEDRGGAEEMINSASAHLRSEVDRIVGKALERIEKACANGERAAGGALRAEDSAARLEHAMDRAESVISRIEEAHRSLSGAGRSAEERVSLLLSSLDTAQGIQERIEQVGEQVSSLVEESNRSALDEQNKLNALFDDVSRRRDELAETLEQMRRTVVTVQADRESVLDESRRLLHDVRRTQADVSAQMEAIGVQSADYNGRVVAMQDAQDKASRLVESATDAARRVEAGLERSAAATRELDEGADRMAEQMATFQGAVTDNKDARHRAEQAVRTARTLLEKVAESEARLADAQQAAVDIEATASSSLTMVQKQVRRIEESVGVVVRHGVDKARGEMAEITDNIQSQVETWRADLEVAADNAQSQADASKSELVEMADCLKSQSEASKSELADMAESAKSELEILRTDVDHASSELVGRMQAACADADARMSTLGQTVEEAKESIQMVTDQQVEQATTAISGAADDAMARASSELTRCVASAAKRGATIVADAAQRIESRANELRESSLAAISERLQQEGDDTKQGVIAAINDAAAAAAEVARSESESATNIATENIQRQVDAASLATRQLADTIVRSQEEAGQLCERTASEIQAAGTAALDNVRIETDVVAMEATARIAEQVKSANETDAHLASTIAQSRQMIAEGDVCREKIDHLIRDVWSLTSTTDQRVRSLEALVQNAQNIDENMNELVEEAKAQVARMSNQSIAAQEHTKTLAAQQERVRETCDAFAERIAEARKAGSDLNDTNTTAKKLVAELAGSSSQIGERIEAAKTLVETIREDDEKVQQTSDALARLDAGAQSMEARLIELQQGLASPMVTIDEARAQADELNEICLAVKRVFRGVSQASLQADERLKQLGKMLTTAERSAMTMQQWVEEATRAQERLSKTLSGAPSIADTHPVVAMPDMTGMPFPAELKGANIDANDRATLRRMAATPRAATPAVANASQKAKAPANPPTAAKQVQPLVEALKERQASQETTTATNRNRLTAEQVRALIAKAQADAVPQT